MKRTLLIALATATALLAVTPASARLDCGRTQRHHFGLADRDLNLALNWARKFPHTSAHVGAVVVQRRNGLDSAGHPGGHVSRIVRMESHCRAIVADEKGTYERDICSRLVAYVDPNGNNVSQAEHYTGAAQITAAPRHHRASSRHRHRDTQTFSAHRHRHHQQFALFAPVHYDHAKGTW